MRWRVRIPKIGRCSSFAHFQIVRDNLAAAGWHAFGENQIFKDPMTTMAAVTDLLVQHSIKGSLFPTMKF
jgi:hypothetical protein